MDSTAVILRVVPCTPGTIALDEWVAMHGPLLSAAALVIGLETCARASRLSDRELGEVIGSLHAGGVIRSTSGGWLWAPTPGGSATHTVTDTEVIERIGAILFHALAGQALTHPVAAEQALRTRLRSLRPELAAGVADLTVRTVSVRPGAGLTLAAFARGLRQVLGVERQSDNNRSRRMMNVLVAASVLFAVLAGVWWAAARGQEDRLEAHGLTNRETALVDVTAETAEGFTLMDEHTAAIQQYQQIARLLRARLVPEDPRLAWNLAHEAWVRALADDRLTAEQMLLDTPNWLMEELGVQHPYTRAVQLALASALDARGATAEATALRVQAGQATRDLLQGMVRETDLLRDIPTPPGVLAHMAPNAAEREGFRRAPDGVFFAPLTSMQRWIAGRDGWRLHLVAAGTCRASFVAGTDPRLIAVNVARSADNGWDVRIEGTKPAMTLHDVATSQGLCP